MTERPAASVDALIAYALEKRLIAAADIVVIRNQLCDLLRIDDPTAVSGRRAESFSLAATLSALSSYAAAKGIIGASPSERDLLETKVMGFLTPMPSRILAGFARREKKDPESALDWFYALCADTNYIRSEALARNIAYTSSTDIGELEITINLAKPEKDPLDIAAERNAPSTGYPACALCRENVGYAGRPGWPARQNLRTLPVELDGEPWYLQYSPYQYYHQHCIIFSHEHRPMGISDRVFARLCAFVARFPSCFLGANAGLPVIGGSILQHDHFQGGKHAFPMDRAKAEGSGAWRSVRVSILRWPLPTIRLEGERAAVINAAVTLQSGWLGWEDEACGILAHTGSARHNAVTPIARSVRDGFRLDIVLRNNRTDAAHPLGIFHPHEDKHHIKKENIGLIEAMGCMILPGRLDEELCHAARALADPSYENDALEKHAPWIAALRARHGTLPIEDARVLLRHEIGVICSGILKDAGVYKQTPEGRAGLGRFLGSVGIDL